MKRAILIGACLGAFLMTTAATCNDDTKVTPEPEPEIKEYTCKCTYVPSATGPNAGQPNKEEEEKIKAEDLNRAKYDCTVLEGKYITQHYSGTCIIQ